MTDSPDSSQQDPLRARSRGGSPRALAGTLVAAGITLLLVAAILVAYNDPGSQSVTPPQRGEAMSNFPLLALDGKTSNMGDYRGRPVLINIWASWCPPCRAEMPLLEAYYQQHKADGFLVLAINAGEDRATAEAFAKQAGITFPVFLDPQENLMVQMGINDYPTSILVGRDGKVKAVHIGLLSEQIIEAEFTPHLGP